MFLLDLSKRFSEDISTFLQCTLSLPYRWREIAKTNRFWFKDDHGFYILSFDGLVYYLTLKWRSVDLCYMNTIAHVTIAMSQNINILCIKFKIRSEQTLQRWSSNYMWWSALYSHVEHLHDRIIAPRGKIQANKTWLYIWFWWGPFCSSF